MDADGRRIYRVDPADLAADSVLLPKDAGVLMRKIGALARAYFGAIDAGDVEAMLGHLDPRGFDIRVLSPDATLTNDREYRDWAARIFSAFSRRRHTVVALEPKLMTRTSAQARLCIHSEVDRRDPGPGEAPRATATLNIIWDLVGLDGGAWAISGQREAPEPLAAFSLARTREFAVGYLNDLDRRSLDGMLAVLAPQAELNIALNGGLIVDDFPQWFRTIDDTFINSVHRVQGLVPLENADGTIDAHLEIHFAADRRHPAPNEDTKVDFSVQRIWTVRPGPHGAPQLISQRPFVAFDLSTRVDPLDVDAALAAARRGDDEVVRDWLRQGGNPNEYGSDGFNLFLAAAATGGTDILRMLLLEGVGRHKVDPSLALRDPARPEYRSGIVAAHLATQKGDVQSTLLLLSRCSGQLHARVEVNGHTPLLQIAFYGHVELARSFLKNLPSILPPGADLEAETRRLFTATTLRGLNATDLGRQFGNQAMVDALAPFDKATPQAKQADTRALLEAIAAGPRNPDANTAAQKASEAVMQAITAGLAEVAALAEPDQSEAVTRVVRALARATQDPSFEANRLAGELLQPPLVAAVTGNDANPGVSRLRREVVELLLQKGADPEKEESHPMGVDAIIRAAVFNHLDILQRFQSVMTPDAMKRALNHKPAVNGLTALHDSVLRAATTGSAGYLEQIRWARRAGAAADIPDHTGRTQRDFAAAAFVTAGQKEHAASVWDALQLDAAPPRPYRFFSYENLTFLTIPDRVADKGTVWRTLAGSPDVIVKSIELDGPNAMSAEVVQNHSFGTAIMNRCWPDGRLVDAKDLQAFAAQTRGTPLLPILRFERPDPYVKELLGTGVFGALLLNPDSPDTVRAFLRDVYFPVRPTATGSPKASTAQHPLGKRAVGADNLAQRTFAEYSKMMDVVNDMFIGGLSFTRPALPNVLQQLPALREIGVRMVEIDRPAMRAELAKSTAAAEVDRATDSAVCAIEDAARGAGLVLSGRFSTDDQIQQAFDRGYRHIVTITERAAHQIAWRSWVPAGQSTGRQPLPREMPVRRPSPDFNDVRRALKDGQLVVFGALTTPDLNNALQLAQSGILNAVAIEREHGTWSTDETVRYIRALREHTNVVVRLCSALDPEVATFVRAGVAALIATAVLDAGEARHFLYAVEKANIDMYGSDKKKWVVPAVMMETESAAADTDKIVPMLKEHEGVCHPGPLDLSASLGAAWGTERYESTLRKIEGAARAAGVPLANVMNTLEQALDQGLGMVLAPVGMDGGALNAGIVGTNPLESLQGVNSAR